MPELGLPIRVYLTRDAKRLFSLMEKPSRAPGLQNITKATEKAGKSAKGARASFWSLGRGIQSGSEKGASSLRILTNRMHGLSTSLYVAGGSWSNLGRLMARGVMILEGASVIVPRLSAQFHGLAASIGSVRLTNLLPLPGLTGALGRFTQGWQAQAAAAGLGIPGLGAAGLGRMGAAGAITRRAVMAGVAAGGPVALGAMAGMAAFATAGAIATKIAQPYIELREELTKLRQVAGFTAKQAGELANAWGIRARKPIEVMTEVTMQLSRQMKVFTVTDIVEAVTEVVKAGYSYQEAIGGAAQTTLRFARIAELSTAEAAQQLADLQQMTGMAFSTLSDYIIKTADISTVGIADVTVAMTQAAFLTQQLKGLTMERLGGLVAVLPRFGLRAERAGNAIRRFGQEMLRLQKTVTGPEMKAFQRLGPAAMKALEQFRRGEIDVFQFTKAIHDAGATYADWATIVQTRAASVGQAMGQFNKEILENAQLLAKAQGLTSERWKELMGTMKAMQDRYAATMNRVRIEAGKGISGIARAWLSFKNWFADFLETVLVGGWSAAWRQMAIGTIRVLQYVGQAIIGTILGPIEGILAIWNKITGMKVSVYRPVFKGWEGMWNKTVEGLRKSIDKIMASSREQANAQMSAAQAAQGLGNALGEAAGATSKFSDALSKAQKAGEDWSQFFPERMREATKKFNAALEVLSSTKMVKGMGEVPAALADAIEKARELLKAQWPEIVPKTVGELPEAFARLQAMLLEPTEATRKAFNAIAEAGNMLVGHLLNMGGAIQVVSSATKKFDEMLQDILGISKPFAAGAIYGRRGPGGAPTVVGKVRRTEEAERYRAELAPWVQQYRQFVALTQQNMLRQMLETMQMPPEQAAALAAKVYPFEQKVLEKWLGITAPAPKEPTYPPFTPPTGAALPTPSVAQLLPQYEKYQHQLRGLREAAKQGRLTRLEWEWVKEKWPLSIIKGGHWAAVERPIRPEEVGLPPLRFTPPVPPTGLTLPGIGQAQAPLTLPQVSRTNVEMGPITINVSAPPGTSPEEIARMVRWELEKKEQEARGLIVRGEAREMITP